MAQMATMQSETNGAMLAAYKPPLWTVTQSAIERSDALVVAARQLSRMNDAGSVQTSTIKAIAK